MIVAQGVESSSLEDQCSDEDSKELPFIFNNNVSSLIKQCIIFTRVNCLPLLPKNKVNLGDVASGLTGQSSYGIVIGT